MATYTTLTALALEKNGSTAITATNCTTAGEGVECTFDDFSQLFIFGYNSDTAAATVKALASTGIYTRAGIGDLSTSIGSSEYRFFYFESAQFKSPTNTIAITTTSTGSTNVDWFAFYIP